MAWAGADDLDLPDPVIKDRAQLYNLDAVAYESIMLGVFAIHRGPHNRVCEQTKKPKITDLEFAYSRDGFHWHRPDRTPYLASTQREGDWDRAYLHTASTICTIVGDRLHLYYSAWSGLAPAGPDMYAGGATGVAFLRRDGFVSMDAGTTAGTLTTRPVTFTGRQLFVNFSAPQGELRAEILDENGNVLRGFAAGDCQPCRGNSTRQQVSWRGGRLEALAGRPLRVRFHLRQGSLYAFWVAADARGASNGYVAAGGPEFSGAMDGPRTD